MYYHVKIKSTKISKDVNNYSHEKLMRSIAIPYLLNQQFRVDGGIFTTSQISSFKITQTEEKFDNEELLKELDVSSISNVLNSIISIGSKIDNGEDVTDDFLQQASQLIKSEGLQPEEKDVLLTQIKNDKLFIACSFSEELSQNYDAIADTCKKFNLNPVRVDKESSSASIIDRITTHIKEARFVVADLTDARPNVYYEIGYLDAICEARNIDASEILLLVAKNIDQDAHFDLKHRGIEQYDNPFTLMKIIESWLKSKGLKS